MSKGSWRRDGARRSAPDPEDGDRYIHVEKSPSRLLNSFGVIKVYPNKKYQEGWDRIFAKKDRQKGDDDE